MTDREWLELAAESCGIDGKFVRIDDGHNPLQVGILTERGVWNPLEYNDDALALAAIHKMTILWIGQEVQVADENYDSANPICAAEVAHEGQAYAVALRRAIGRVAAEIGRKMGVGEEPCQP